MRLIFVDDSTQSAPSRPKLGTLVGAGGVSIKEDKLQSAHSDLDALCAKFGFPDGEIFKCSPGPDHWMRKNLVGERRSQFQHAVLDVLEAHECKTLFVAEDSPCRPDTDD